MPGTPTIEPVWVKPSLSLDCRIAVHGWVGATVQVETELQTAWDLYLAAKAVKRANAEGEANYRDNITRTERLKSELDQANARLREIEATL